MPEIIRARDCVVFQKDGSITVAVDEAMVAGGWPGGQGVMWTNTSSADQLVVTYSNGPYGGFLVWGSDEPGDRFTAMTNQQTHYRYATMWVGACFISTTTYEQYTWASRTGGGPLVPIVYSSNDYLYFSLRGLWTNEDELTLSGAPKPSPLVGTVSQIPKVVTNNYLGIQTIL